MTIRYDQTHLFHSGTVEDLDISPDGRLLATVGSSPGLAVFDLEEVTGREPKTIKKLKSKLECCAFSPDGRYLAVGGKTVKVYELPKFKLAGSLKMSRRAHVAALAWSPDSTTLAAAAEVKRQASELAIWEVATDTVQKYSSDHIGRGGYDRPKIFAGLEFSPDGSSIAASSWGSCFGAFCFDYQNDKVWRPSPDPIEMLHSADTVAWRDGGREVLFDARLIGGDAPIIDEYIGRLIRWRPEENAIVDVPTPGGYKFWGFTMHPDEEHVVLYVEDKDEVEGEEGMFHEKTLMLMSLEDGSYRRLLDADVLWEGTSLSAYRVSADGAKIAVAARLGTIVVLEEA